jgi:hypothetical protein
MIDKKLDELGKYAEDIENQEPFDLLKTHMNQVYEKLKITDDRQSELELDFEKEIMTIINSYKEKGLSSSIIGYNLFRVLINSIKKSAIEKKASELDIDRTLYKQQMRLLFKGKWK